MNIRIHQLSVSEPTTHALAWVGVATLVGAGMWLAIYSTRFVPGIVNSIGSAAVYLGSVFTPAEEPTLSVIPTPTASTTIPFGDDASSTPAAVTPASPIQPSAGTQTNSVIPIGGEAPATSTPAVLSGLPDLTVTVNAVGYLATSSAASFVATSTVPAQLRPAVNFTIKNVGTNVASSWRFNASIPTQTAYVYLSEPQQALAPGDSIEYTLGFDMAKPGADEPITITVNPSNAFAESSTENNKAVAHVTVLSI